MKSSKLQRSFAVPSMFAVDATSGRTATLRIYGTIGRSWYSDGADPLAIAKALDDIDADTIEVHIHSPGGVIHDAVAIKNALERHPARIVAVVDGLAASSASWLAVCADEVVMAQDAQLMIHDAWTITLGDAADHHAQAALLDKFSDQIAAIYARRAGGDPADWRQAMRAETWYSDEEAVAAGLADRILKAADAGDAASENTLRRPAFDLSAFEHAGRDHAPAPFIPRAASAARVTPPAASAASGDTTQKEVPLMEFTPEQINDLRRQLGVPADAAADTILNALTEALAEQADPAPAALPDGVVAVDQAVLDELRADAALGRAAHDHQMSTAREQAVDAAVADGRIAPANRQPWLDRLAADPTGAEAKVLASLAPGLVPVDERGHAQDTAPSDSDALYGRLFAPTKEI